MFKVWARKLQVGQTKIALTVNTSTTTEQVLSSLYGRDRTIMNRFINKTLYFQASKYIILLFIKILSKIKL